MPKQRLNKIQQLAVESTNKPVLIFAGAGSGKTRVLIHKIAYLIEKENYKAENILAVTFTNKAAKEMRERASKLLNNANIPIIIGTFHSLCARILRNEAKYLNLSSQFVIYDVQDQVDLLKILLKKL